MTQPKQAPWRDNLIVLAFFSLLTFMLTWPVVARLDTELAGGRDDLWVHQWTFWSVREALQNGTSPFSTTNLYFPTGVALTSHNIAWFNIGAWLPLQAVFGPTVAYNLVFLTVIALNGFCMYLFAREVVRDRAAALVAGFIFGFWPYTLSHYDHANMMVVFWVPFTLLLLTRLITRTPVSGKRGSGWGLVVATAGSLAMIGVTRWQLLIMSSPILVTFPIYLLITIPREQRRGALLQLLVVGGLATLLMAPLAAPFVIDQFTRDFPEDVLLDEAVWGRTDLLAYLVPSIHNGLWQQRVAGLYERFVVNQFYTPYLGYTTLLLAAAGVLRRWRQTWVWLGLALLYFVLALGPELAFNGQAYPAIPMPYRLVEDWLVMGLIRRPDRLNVFLSLPLAMMAAWGLNWLLGVWSTPRARWIVGTAVMGMLTLAYWTVPFETTPLEVPNWYKRAALDGESYAVVDLPINDRSYDKWYMAYQTEHGKPLATGHVSRLPREATAFLDGVPLLANLEERDQLPDPNLREVTEQLGLLNEAGIRYLVIHKKFANVGLQAAWKEWLAVEPDYEDGEVLVYRTLPQFGRDFAWAFPMNKELGLVDASVEPREAVQGGAVVAALTWGTDQRPKSDYVVCLRLRDEQGEIRARECSSVATSTWPEDDVRRGTAVLLVPRDLAPGSYRVEFYLADEDGERVLGEAAVLGEVLLRPFAPRDSVDICWESDVCLLGYDLAQEGNALAATLYWESATPPKESYKVFVHVIDPQTGAIVAQSDGLPRGWSYPTNQWQAGEIVRDEHTLAVEGITKGQFEVRVGLYDEASGKRSNLRSSKADDSFVLGKWKRE